VFSKEGTDSFPVGFNVAETGEASGERLRMTG
jgi:hypothetical protein